MELFHYLAISLFVGGFGLGCGLGIYLERKLASRIIGGIVQPQQPSNQFTNKSIIIGRIDQTTTRKLP